MNLRKRLGLLAVAVAAIVAAVMAFVAHNSADPATGTQSDSHVGTTKNPAPKGATSVPPKNALATITAPSAIPALIDVTAKCDSASPHATNRPSLQDNGKGAQKLSDMPANPGAGDYKCAIARAQAAGYYVTGNSVACDESIVELHEESTNKNWSFRPFCMNLSQSDDPTCKVTLIVTDYQGNFIWQDMTKLSWDQDILGDKLRLRGSFAGCA